MTMMARVDPVDNIAAQKGEKLKRTRVEYLVHDLRRMGHDRPTREVAAKLVEDTFRGGLSLREKDELAELVMDAMRPRQNTTGDEEERVTQQAMNGELTTERVVELATEYLRGRPDATSARVWKHVTEHGKPPMKRVSFATYTLVKIRKELGLSGGTSTNGGRSSGKSKSRPKKKAAPKAAAAEKQPAAEPATSAKEEEPEAHGSARPDDVQSDTGVHTTADAATAGTFAAAPEAAPETFRLEMPAGEITAVRKGNSGPWHVTMEADLHDDALAELVRDLVASLPIDVAGGW